MPYKVKNSKNGDGTYTLSYGRGKQKLTAQMQNIKGKGWCIDDFPNDGGFKKMKDAKEAWGAWAEDAYGNESGSKAESETPPDQQSPKSPATPGPPTFKRTGRVQGKTPNPSNTPKSGEPLGFEHNADPFDPRFKNDDKELTPLGVLVEIGAWCARHADIIKQVEKKTYPQAAFTTLMDQVKHTLARECPDIFNGDKHVEEQQQAPAAAAAPSSAPASTPAGGPPPPPTFVKPAAPSGLSRADLDAAVNNYHSAGAALERIDEEDIPF